jgi:hypothetical protein
LYEWGEYLGSTSIHKFDQMERTQLVAYVEIREMVDVLFFSKLVREASA